MTEISCSAVLGKKLKGVGDHTSLSFHLKKSRKRGEPDRGVFSAGSGLGSQAVPAHLLGG